MFMSLIYKNYFYFIFFIFRKKGSEFKKINHKYLKTSVKKCLQKIKNIIPLIMKWKLKKNLHFKKVKNILLFLLINYNRSKRFTLRLSKIVQFKYQ